MHRHLAPILIALAAAPASAQEQVIASLPWTNGATAGPNGSDYEPPNDNRDIWIGEDFTTTRPVTLTRFLSYGTVYPTPYYIYDMTVQIWDAQPPSGHILLSSRPGSGQAHSAGFNSWFTAEFDNAPLPPGSYWVVWSAATRTNPPYQQIAIFSAESGPHSVGGGLPDNGIQWNPGGGWGWPNNWHIIYGQLGGGGVNGCNFTLYGNPPPCYANCDLTTTPPVLNIADFVCFQSRFAAGDSYANCDGSTTPPILNISDFICFQSAFAAGCP